MLLSHPIVPLSSLILFFLYLFLFFLYLFLFFLYHSSSFAAS